MLANAILAVLEDGPLHGYAIRRALAERIGLLWPLNQGQVYSTLRRLARDRQVAAIAQAPTRSARQRGRRYELTASGRRRLADWLRRPAGLDDARDELAVKLAVAAELGDRARLRGLVAAQHRACADLLATMRVALDAGGRGASAGAASPRRAAEDPARRARTTAVALLDAEVAWLARLLETLDPGAPAGDT